MTESPSSKDRLSEVVRSQQWAAPAPEASVDLPYMPKVAWLADPADKIVLSEISQWAQASVQAASLH